MYNLKNVQLLVMKTVRIVSFVSVLLSLIFVSCRREKDIPVPETILSEYQGYLNQLENDVVAASSLRAGENTPSPGGAIRIAGKDFYMESYLQDDGSLDETRLKADLIKVGLSATDVDRRFQIASVYREKLMASGDPSLASKEVLRKYSQVMKTDSATKIAVFSTVAPVEYIMSSTQKIWSKSMGGGDPRKLALALKECKRRYESAIQRLRWTAFWKGVGLGFATAATSITTSPVGGAVVAGGGSYDYDRNSVCSSGDS